MNDRHRRLLQTLEGRAVNLALADGSRIDDAVLVSSRTSKAWIYCNGVDAFVPLSDLVDVWESRSAA